MHHRLAAALAAASVLIGGLAVGAAPAGAVPPDPVIIVAGTVSPAFANEPLAARIRAEGYQVWIFELPGLGTGDIRESARALNRFADGIRSQTGAARVDLVGHSQGGLVGRAYIKYEGGATEVDSLVSLGTPHYGTSLANIARFFSLGTCVGILSCHQMATGSSFLNDLNAGDDTVGNVRYTNIYTSFDEVVFPVTNATMQDGATNVRVQSQCWARVVGHLGLIVDGTVYSGVSDALAGRSITLNCWAI
ncbi:MAG TPA: alpha/beta fold hydrolase [Acidimicrobiales bacterium]|nr:alpha/beta fold hydrolase [Acidimicrobiales bacterium]